MAFSNSFHSSSKSHSIGSSASLSKVGRHNSRGYLSFYYDADKIHALIGMPERIPSEVAHFINDTFGTCVDEYNKKQKRSDRMIRSDAFSYFCGNKKLDVAVESILQIGDMDFWARHRTTETIRRRGKEYVLKDFPDEVKKVMDDIFLRQVEAYEHIYETDGDRILEKIKAHYEKSQATLAEFAENDPHTYRWCAELAGIKNLKTRESCIDELSAEEKEKYTIFAEAYFAVESIDKFRYAERIQNKQMHIKVTNSVSHYDEWSPHNHVVSVCWADGYQNGLSSRVAKSMVLNRYALEVLQEKMHDIALEEIAKHPEIFADEPLKEKTRGRNFDFTTEQFLRKKQEELLQNVDELETQNKSLRKQGIKLSNAIAELEELKTLAEYQAQVVKNDYVIDGISKTLDATVESAVEEGLPPNAIQRILHRVLDGMSAMLEALRIQISRVKLFERFHWSLFGPGKEELAGDRQEGEVDALIRNAKTRFETTSCENETFEKEETLE